MRGLEGLGGPSGQGSENSWRFIRYGWSWRFRKSGLGGLDVPGGPRGPEGLVEPEILGNPEGLGSLLDPRGWRVLRSSG